MKQHSFTVKRAIIVAAGQGKRLLPLTLKTPKPLIRVNGIRLIDTIIQSLHINGIHEIFVVTGYKKELFSPLESDYPGLKLIENPDYLSCNNISSLYAAKDHLEECFILDGDQFINDPTVLDPRSEMSGYNAVWCEDNTDEWLLTTENGVIKSCSKTGGSHGWQLFSISRWNKADGLKLRTHIEAEFKKNNRQIYWDDVPLFCYPDEYSLGITEMKKNDVYEIDTTDDLTAIKSKNLPVPDIYKQVNGEDL